MLGEPLSGNLKYEERREHTGGSLRTSRQTDRHFFVFLFACFISPRPILNHRVMRRLFGNMFVYPDFNQFTRQGETKAVGFLPFTCF